MGLRRPRRLATQLAVAAALLVAACTGVVAGCSAPGRAPESTAATIKGILGHDPTGVAATVAQKRTLVVGLDAAYPPQSSVDPSSKRLIGFNVDVALRVAAIIKTNVTFVTPGWDRIPSALGKGRCDVAIDSLPITTAGRRVMAFTAPYVYQDAALLVPSSAAALNGAAQLQGLTIGAVVQSVYQLWLEKLGGVNVQIYAEEGDATDALMAGKVAGVMTDQATAYRLIDGGAPFAQRGPFFFQPLGFATAPGQTDLVALLNHVIARMRRDGSLARISAKWYNGHDLTKAPPAGLPRYEP
jgi:ABC-type amino acid transport substrate-binding protein